jgi:glycosyltransferase involved in cell wall biosynthesis
MDPLVSIVMPVFNEEKYLSDSIESVLNQSYKNFECIILDNCSKDASYEIAKKYEKIDGRIRIYKNTSFLGQIQNHNEAVRKISNNSKYCKMVFGDDYIFKECLERMVEIAESDPTIGLVSSYALRGSEVVCTGLPFGKNLYNGKEIAKRYLLSYNFCVFPNQNSVMYLSDIVRSKHYFFNDLSLTPDIDVCLDILRNYNFGFINQVLTFTRIDNVSERSRMRINDTGIMRRLILLERYREMYLSKEEYKKSEYDLKRKYYNSLAAKIIINKNFNFWKFHEKELSKVGLQIHKIVLCKYMFIGVLRKLLNPMNTITDLFIKKKYEYDPP